MQGVRNSNFVRISVENLEDRTVPSTAYALDDTNQIFRFDTANPSKILGTVKAQGLDAATNETLVGIDFRPRTGQLYGLVVSDGGIGNTARLVIVDPLTGLTFGGFPQFAIAGSPINPGYGFDFNPTVDRIRVVNQADTNIRLNPNDGTVAATDTPLTPALQGIDSSAYSNNFDSRGIAAKTTLYAINSGTGELVTIGGIDGTPSPNGGVITTVGQLGGTISQFGVVGFDITNDGVAFASLDDADPADKYGLYTIDLATGQATLVGLIGDGSTKLLGLAIAKDQSIGVGTDAGATILREFSETGTQLSESKGTGTAGVRVAVADFNGDGVDDVVVGSGPGEASKVVVSANGQDTTIESFEASFTGGVYVAGGDMNQDGYADIIISPDQGGGPRVRIISGKDNKTVIADFLGIQDDNFRGGARVAVGDINGDGFLDLVVSAGFLGGPRITIWDGKSIAAAAGNGNKPTGNPLANFFAFEETLRNGVFVATADVDGDGIAELVFGGGPGGGPRVRIVDSTGLLAAGSFGSLDNPAVSKLTVSNFFAGDANTRGGIRVLGRDLNADGAQDIITGSGTASGSKVIAYSGTTLLPNDAAPALLSFDAFPGFTNGVFVG